MKISAEEINYYNKYIKKLQLVIENMDAVILFCKDKLTNKILPVLCSLKEDKRGSGFDVVPLAQLFDFDPFERYEVVGDGKSDIVLVASQKDHDVDEIEK
jgi:hypothetical protein